MLIELDSDNRASLPELFDRYPCLHGVVAAVIEGGMGRVFADARGEPQVALAVLDFHLLAGDPLHANAPLLFRQLQSGNTVVPPTPAWRQLVDATWQVRPEEIAQFATDLDRALIYNFRSHEEFITRAFGMGILHQGRFVSGAAAAAVGGGKIEIEIQTHRQFRRAGWPAPSWQP